MQDSTAIEAAYKAIKDDVITGVREPNERLRISRLSEIYGYGPSAIREALQRLHSDGLVVAMERRGFQVTWLEESEFRDINTARIEVECAALRLSLENGGENWEAELVAAAYQLERADSKLPGLATSEYADWEQKNARFHVALIAGCPSKTLLRICRQMNEHVERYRRASVVRSLKERDVSAEHRGLAEASLRRDTQAAVSLLAQHYKLTVEIFARNEGPLSDGNG